MRGVESRNERRSCRRLLGTLLILAATSGCGKSEPPEPPTAPPTRLAVGLDARDGLASAGIGSQEPDVLAAGTALTDAVTPPAGPDSAAPRTAEPGDIAAGPAADAGGGEASDAGLPAAAKVAPKHEEGGPAWFAVQDVGLVRLAGGRFEVVSALPLRTRDMALATHAMNDGTVWLAGHSGTYAWGDGKLVRAGDMETPGTLDRIALGPDGTVWGATFRGIAYLADGAWVIEPKEAALGPDIKRVQDLAVDKSGQVWVTTPNAVHVRKPLGKRRRAARKPAKLWRTLPLDGLYTNAQMFFRAIAIGGDSVWLAHGIGVLRRKDDQWDEWPLGRVGTLDQVEVRGDRLHAANSRDLVLAPVPPAEGRLRRLSGATGHFPGRKIATMAADDAGRTWAATDGGLAVVHPDDTVYTYRLGTVPELRGEIVAIAVRGTGPALPPAGPAAFGSVTGKVGLNDKAVEGAVVQLCPRPSTNFESSPCADAPWHAVATTGADGGFVFERVPLGTYRFAAKHDGQWTVTAGACCTGMSAGKPHDVGIIHLKLRPKP